MKQKGHQGGGGANSGFPTEQPPDLPALDPNAPSFWNDQPNMRNLNGGNSLSNPESALDTNIDVPCLVPNSPSNSGESADFICWPIDYVFIYLFISTRITLFHLYSFY